MAVAAAGASVTILVTDPDSVLDIRAFAQVEGFPCEVSEAPPGVWCFRLSKP
jgi:TusA-related sulfurtransferase